MKNSLTQTQQQTQQQLQLQQQSLLQVMTARLTELPLEALRQEIDKKVDENPYLEKSTEECDGYDGYTREEAEYNPMDDYSNSDDVPDYQWQGNGGSQSERAEWDIKDAQTFYDMLMEQAGEFSLSSHERQILEYLIGSLEDDGLLKKPLFQIADELDIWHNCPTTPQEVESVLHTLWKFEPSGVGARSTQECLMLQVRRKGGDRHSLLMQVLEKNWDDIEHNRFDRIQRAYQLSSSQLSHLHEEIKRLNPRPGSAMGESLSQGSRHITPDFIIEVTTENTIEMSLNESDMPTLKISDDAHDMLSESFVRGYVDEGKLFMSAITQRRQTMIKTMKAIIRLQKAYFLDGDESSLRPMKLEDISSITHQDLSTISRVCSSKYAQTPYGIVPLKWFFSAASHMSGQTQDEEISTRQVKAALREIVDCEDKRHPLSDDALCQHLQQIGYTLARRTVAKYREQLGIPTSRMRVKI